MSNVTVKIIILICCINLCYPYQTENEDTNIFISRLNYGILFKAHTLLDNSNSHWKHVYKIKLPNYPHELTPVSYNCSNNFHLHHMTLISFDFCSIYKEMLDTYEKQSTHLTNDIKRNIQAIHTIMHKNDRKRRSKRGLLDIVGEGFKTLFGVSTTSDYRNLLDIISKFEDQSHNMHKSNSELKDDLLSFTTLNNQQHQNTHKKIMINYNNTQIILQQLHKIQTSFDSLTTTTTAHQNVLTQFVQFIQNMVTLWHQRITALQFLQSDSIEQLQAFETLTNNKLSPRLIDPLTLEQLFTHIAQTLQEQYLHFSITNPNIESVYDRPTVTHYINSDYVYIQISIPLSDYDATFKIFKIYNFPIPVTHNITSIYTQYTNIPEYIAISLDNNHYMQLSSEQLSTCYDDSFRIKHCQQNLPISNRHVPSCALALYIDNSKQINSLCISSSSFNIKPNNVVIPLGGTSYFILTDNKDNWQIECSRRLPQTPVCNFCIIKLPRKCSLITNTFTIPPSVTNCSGVKSESNLEINYPLNLNFLSAWLYNAQILKQFDGNSILTVPHIETPAELNFISNIPKELIDEQEQITINTNKLIEKLKQNEIIYLNPISEMIQKVRDSLSVFPSWIHYIHITFNFLVIVVIITIVIIIVRLHNISHLLILMSVNSQFKLNHALSIPSPIQNKQISINYIEFPTSEFYIGSSILISLIILAIILLITQLHKKRKYLCKPFRYFSSPRIQTHILIELMSPKGSVMLEVTKLPCHLTQIQITNPSITLHSFIGGYCQTYLRVNWHATTLAITHKFSNIMLPELIPVPWSLKALTTHITNDNNLKMFIFVGSSGIYQSYKTNHSPRQDNQTPTHDNEYA